MKQLPVHLLEKTSEIQFFQEKLQTLSLNYEKRT